MLTATRFARDRGVKVIVVTQPYASDTHVAQQRALSAALSSTFGSDGGVRYVNLGPTINLRDRAMAYDGVHLVAKGTRSRTAPRRSRDGADEMTSILGISAFYHDSAAALIVDGEIVAAAQEERFSRKKHDEGFPTRAVAFCLERAGIDPERLDYVGFYDKPLLKVERLLETYLAYAPRGFRSFREAAPIWLKRKLHLSRHLREALGGKFRRRFVFPEHHESHAASAFSRRRSPRPRFRRSTASANGRPRPRGGLGTGFRGREELHFPHSSGAVLRLPLLLRLRGQQREGQADGLARTASLATRRESCATRDLKSDGSLRMDMALLQYCQGDHDVRAVSRPVRRPSPTARAHTELQWTWRRRFSA